MVGSQQPKGQSVTEQKNLQAGNALRSSYRHMKVKTVEEIEKASKTGPRLAYRLREASDLIGIPVSTLRTMAKRGEFNPVTAFGPWLITADDLSALMERRLR